VAPSLSASSTAFVISSTNSAMPSVRSMMSCRMPAGGKWDPSVAASSVKGRGHSVVTQSTYKGGGLPMAVRHLINEPFACSARRGHRSTPVVGDRTGWMLPTFGRSARGYLLNPQT
jgi:hypothetical protein